ncbi:ERF family protein [Tsuneonella sp. HG222]
MATQLKELKGGVAADAARAAPPTERSLQAVSGTAGIANAGVYAKIAAVQGELAHTGIGKDSENSFDRYKFRGIDAVYNALAPLLAKHGLCVLPRIIDRESIERVSKKGDPMFYVTVTAEFDFVSADDGSVHTVRTYGEAMDRSDKATNKAMSAAYKYAAFMAFAIPTEGDNDADASTPEVEVGVVRDTARESAIGPDSPKHDARKEPWGKFYSGKAALHKGLTAHAAELRRIGDEGAMDDLESYLTSPEYAEFVQVAGEHAPHYLEGGPPAPEEFQSIFSLEQRARDLIALRGGRAAEPQGGK